MTITEKDFSMDRYAYKIDIGAGLVVDRTFALRNGEVITFQVKLQGRDGTTLVDINRESIERAIEILQAALPTTSQAPSGDQNP